MSYATKKNVQPVKFDFEREFSKDKIVVPRRERKKTRWSEEEVQAIRLEAHAAGEEAGRTSAEAEAARQLTEHMSLLASAASTLTRTLATERTELRNDAAEISLALARKLAPALMQTAPTAEIESILADALAYLRSEPRVVVRVAPELESRLSPRIAEIAADQGFESALVVRADDTIAPGDARIEWAKGEIIRDTPALEARIEEIVRSYLAAPTDDASMQTDLMSLLGKDA